MPSVSHYCLVETVTHPKTGKIDNECNLPFQASTFSVLVERAQQFSVQQCLPILLLPGETVDILVKGHCNQNELTYFSHKIAPLSRFLEELFLFYEKLLFTRYSLLQCFQSLRLIA